MIVFVINAVLEVPRAAHCMALFASEWGEQPLVVTYLTALKDIFLNSKCTRQL